MHIHSCLLSVLGHLMPSSTNTAHRGTCGIAQRTLYFCNANWWNWLTGNHYYTWPSCVFNIRNVLLFPLTLPSSFYRHVCWCDSSMRLPLWMQCRGWSGNSRCRSWTLLDTNLCASTRSLPFTCQWLTSTMTSYCCLRDTNTHGRRVCGLKFSSFKETTDSKFGKG